MNPDVWFHRCGSSTNPYEECIHVQLYKIRTSKAKIDTSTSTDSLVTSADKCCQCPDDVFEHNGSKGPSRQTLISDYMLRGGTHAKRKSPLTPTQPVKNSFVLPRQPDKNPGSRTSLGSQQQKQDDLKPCEFDDIAVYFTDDEWAFLNENQKKLYADVMTENYQALLSLGWASVKPAVISRIERGEELCGASHSQPKIDGSLLPTDEAKKLTPTGGGDASSSRKSHHVTKDVAPIRSHPSSLFVCSLCNTFKSDLVKPHIGDKALICNECSKCKPIAPVPGKHDVTGLSFPCSECVRSFTSASDLAAHQTLHGGAKSLSCAECGLSFKQKSHLFVHQMTHKEEKLTSGTENGKCMIVCNCAVKHNQKEVYACLECGHTFNRKSDLVRHGIIHTEVKPFACPECDMHFKQKSDLVRHQVIHMAGRPRICGECGKWFRDKQSLLAHQKTHASETSFRCSDCGKRFSNGQDFVQHQRFHTEERPFTCPECGKTFANNQNLLRHKRTHTADKRFQCSECSKYFFNKVDLVIHQNVHFRDYL